MSQSTIISSAQYVQRHGTRPATKPVWPPNLVVRISTALDAADKNRRAILSFRALESRRRDTGDATPERRNVRSFPLSPPQRGEGRGEGSRSGSKGDLSSAFGTFSPLRRGEGQRTREPHKHWEFLGSVSEESGRAGGARLVLRLPVAGSVRRPFPQIPR